MRSNYDPKPQSEAGVQLNRVKVLDIEIQEFGGRRLVRVERPFPVLVMEDRGSDADGARHSQKWMTAGRRVLASFRIRANIFATRAENTQAEFLLCVGI